MDAEDTAAETFFQVLASRIDLETITHPRAYLSTIAQRLIFKIYRRQHLEAAYLERLAALPAATMPSPEETFLLMEALISLEQALSGLPNPVKKAFLLSQLDGFDYTEIARRLEVSERTVGRYMTQALRHCLLTGSRP
jgi:RNA polymerase sigma-70 factor (ECF subfamily)